MKLKKGKSKNYSEATEGLVLIITFYFVGETFNWYKKQPNSPLFAPRAFTSHKKKTDLRSETILQ